LAARTTLSALVFFDEIVPATARASVDRLRTGGRPDNLDLLGLDCLRKVNSTYLVALSGLLLLPGLVYLLVPYAPACLYRTSLGVRCPGCGVGTALAALSRLDLAAAVVAYPPLPLIVALYALAVALLARGVLRTASNGGVRAGRGRLGRAAATVLALGIVAAALGNWIFHLIDEIGDR
jgi:hypothetical protein